MCKVGFVCFASFVLGTDDTTSCYFLQRRYFNSSTTAICIRSVDGRDIRRVTEGCDNGVGRELMCVQLRTYIPI